MDMSHVDPVAVASYVAAGALASTKLISAAKPLWNRLPRWLAVALPVMVLDLPQVSQYFTGATTGQALFTAFIASVGLLLPGLAEAEHPSDPKPPAASPPTS